jgi:hypothetical protein
LNKQDPKLLEVLVEIEEKEYSSNTEPPNRQPILIPHDASHSKVFRNNANADIERGRSKRKKKHTRMILLNLEPKQTQ